MRVAFMREMTCEGDGKGRESEKKDGLRIQEL